MVAEGEHQTQDFKFAVSDAHKIARSLSAFANRDGGRLLIGVKDNGVLAGVRNEEDIYVVEQAAVSYCRPAVHVEFSALSFDSDARVIIAFVGPALQRPVFVAEADGALKAYYRVADENIVAHPLMVRAWQSAAEAVPKVFGEAHARMLDYLSQPRPADAREVALALHIAELKAEQLIVDLAAMGAVRFEYTRSGFTVSAAD